MRIDKNSRSFIAVQKAVDRGDLAGGREDLHDAVLVGGRDNQSVLRCNDQVAAGFAVAAARNLIQKIGRTQIGDPGDGTDDCALRIADRCGHDNNGSQRFLAHHRLADG